MGNVLCCYRYYGTYGVAEDGKEEESRIMCKNVHYVLLIIMYLQRRLISATPCPIDIDIANILLRNNTGAASSGTFRSGPR